MNIMRETGDEKNVKMLGWSCYSSG